jgi:hypothetical protein
LTAIEFAYNNSKNASTKLTPFEVDTGRNPLIPSNLLISSAISKAPAASEFIKKFANNLKIAKDNLTLAQQRQSKYADFKRRDEKFEVGTLVLLSTQNLADNKFRKLQPRFIGPFKISKVITPTAYRLDLPETFKIHPVFHVSLLRRYHTENDRSQDTNFLDFIPSDSIEYEVEEILNHRIRRGKRQYLIKWLGYPQDDNTWEPEENLLNAKEILKEYQDKITSRTT